MSHPSVQDIPERRENWAHAEFKGGAKSVVTTRSGHVFAADEPPGFAGGTGGENTGPTPTGFLVAAFAADIPAVLNRIARELGMEVRSMRARVQIAWNPRAIAGAPGLDPVPYEALSEIYLDVSGDAALRERMKAAYLQRCPLYNLFRKAGCRMVDDWHFADADQSA